MRRGFPKGVGGDGDIQKQLQAAADGAADAAVLGNTARKCTESTKVFRSALSVAQSIAGQAFYTLAILLILFIIHQASATITL